MVLTYRKRYYLIVRCKFLLFVSKAIVWNKLLSKQKKTTNVDAFLLQSLLLVDILKDYHSSFTLWCNLKVNMLGAVFIYEWSSTVCMLFETESCCETYPGVVDSVTRFSGAISKANQVRLRYRTSKWCSNASLQVFSFQNVRASIDINLVKKLSVLPTCAM